MPFTTETHPGVHPQPPEQTRGFVLNHTMLRVKDPAVALDFYTRVMGMRVLRRLDFPDMRFSLYFLARPAPGETPPEDAGERTAWTFGQRAVLELTHNWGTEADPAFAYHNGNSEPRGFGHIGISVPDVYAAAERFEALGVEFVKRPDDGAMKGLAFIKDPDGYWIEILSGAGLRDLIMAQAAPASPPP